MTPTLHRLAGRSDRSPTGTGTCARMAVLHARGQMAIGDSMIHESLIGSQFHGRIVSDVVGGAGPRSFPRYGPRMDHRLHTYLLDPDDPFPEGYLLPDSWGITGTMTSEYLEEIRGSCGFVFFMSR